MMFGQPQQPQQSPAMFGGGQIPPQLLQMIMQQMQQGGMQPGQTPQMPPQPGAMPTPQTPPNIPQQGLMPGQMPLAGSGPSQQMNPLASILGNQGGAMGPQGGMQNGSAMGGGGMGGIMQIINAMKANQQTNGQQPPQGAPGGIDIAALLRSLGGNGGAGGL